MLAFLLYCIFCICDENDSNYDIRLLLSINTFFFFSKKNMNLQIKPMNHLFSM